MPSSRLDIPMPGEPRRGRRTWADAERDAILDDARNHYPLELSGEVAALRASDRRSVVLEVAEQMRVRDDARRQLEMESSKASFARFEGLSLRDALLVPRPVVPPLIEGLQGDGHKATLVAQYKTGKTTIVGNVARALADGRPLFDRFDVPPLAGEVAIFDYELTGGDALDLYRSLGIERDDRLHVESLRGTGFTLANDHHAALAIEFLRSRSVAYWVLDPFGRAMRGFGSENSNDDVRAFLMRIDEIVAEAGVRGVLLPVHTGRATAEVGDERARGATVLDDDPDARWILTRSEDRRFFRAEGRSGINVPEFALTFDPASGRLSGTNESRRDVAGQRFRPHVMGWVSEHPGSTVNEIKASVNGKDAHVAAALKAWVDEGEIVTVRDGRAIRHYVAGSEPEASL